MRTNDSATARKKLVATVSTRRVHRYVEGRDARHSMSPKTISLKPYADPAPAPAALRRGQQVLPTPGRAARPGAIGAATIGKPKRRQFGAFGSGAAPAPSPLRSRRARDCREQERRSSVAPAPLRCARRKSRPASTLISRWFWRRLRAVLFGTALHLRPDPTVPLPTPNSAAILWTPLPPSFSAFRMAASIAGFNRGLPKRLARLLRPGQPGVDALVDHRPLELGERPADLEDQPAGRCRRVDVLLIEVEIDADRFEMLDGREWIREGAPDAVNGPDVMVCLGLFLWLPNDRRQINADVDGPGSQPRPMDDNCSCVHARWSFQPRPFGSVDDRPDRSACSIARSYPASA